MTAAGWMLLVAVSSPSGEYLGNLTLGPYATKKQCQTVKLDKSKTFKYNRLCVTVTHYTGQSVDKNIAMD